MTAATKLEAPVKERPILFSGPIVRAILEGRKTQTRRVVKQKRTVGAGIERLIQDKRSADVYGPCPYGQPGDRLWVRETWHPVIRRPVSSAEAWWPGREEWRGIGTRPSIPSRQNTSHVVIWRADGEMPAGFPEPWTSPIFMPRWASRLTLEVTEVRVERLQDISEEDAKAEGVEWTDPPGGLNVIGWRGHRFTFGHLWDDINGPGAWVANPWVWVVGFKRVQP